MNAKPKRQIRFRRRLSLERLDDRILMSASPPKAVTVESYNLYAGAGFDLEKALANPSAFLATLSGSPAAQIANRTQQWKDVQATKFNERAEVIARQIAANKPDLIGLQEVWTYSTGVPDSLNGAKPNATKVELDFLKVLTQKLVAKGVPYVPRAITLEHDDEAPAYINGVLRDLRATERLVTLVRADLETSGVVFTNSKQGVFAANSSLQTKPTYNYGWNSIDVNWGGRKFRFVNMCLDIPIFPVTQAFQATEIVTGPAATTLPVILVGDSNTGGNSSWPAYQILVGAGFKDAWAQTHPGEPGYTFGNRPDLKSNTDAMTYLPMRMDLVLYRGPFTATSMKRLGVLQSERTVSKMWPSDHAGIVATLAVTAPLPKAAFSGQSAVFVTMDPAALAKAASTGGGDAKDFAQSRPSSTGTAFDMAVGDVCSVALASGALPAQDAGVGTSVAARSSGGLEPWNDSRIAEPTRTKLSALVDHLMADESALDLLTGWH